MIVGLTALEVFFDIDVLASDGTQGNCRAGGKSDVSVNAGIKIRESVHGNEDVIGGVFLSPRYTNGLSSDPGNDVLVTELYDIDLTIDFGPEDNNSRSVQVKVEVLDGFNGNFDYFIVLNGLKVGL